MDGAAAWCIATGCGVRGLSGAGHGRVERVPEQVPAGVGPTPGGAGWEVGLGWWCGE